MAWVETDLRQQISWSNGRASAIPVSSILHSALRRIVERKNLIPQTLRELKPYLYTAAKNVRLEKLRKINVLKRKPKEAIIFSVGDKHQLLEQASNSDPDLWEAIERLPQEQSDAIKGRYLCNYSHQEYADLVGMNRKSVERLLQRSHKALSRILEEQDS